MFNKGQSTLEYLICVSIIIFACLCTIPKVIKSYNNSLETVTNSMIFSSESITKDIKKEKKIKKQKKVKKHKKIKKNK